MQFAVLVGDLPFRSQLFINYFSLLKSDPLHTQSAGVFRCTNLVGQVVTCLVLQNILYLLDLSFPK